MKRIVVVAVAVIGLAGLGWWGYAYNRAAGSPGLEIFAKGGEAPGKGDAGGKGGDPGGKGGDPGGKGVGAKGPRGPVGVEATKAVQMALADDISAVGNLRATR